MTPYKSKPKMTSDKIGAQERFTHGHSHPLQGMVCYDCGHLFASVRHDPFSRYARCLETPSPSRALLAHRHASPLSRAENIGRAGPLDSELDHGLAFSPCAQGGLLEYPSAAGVVGAGSLQRLATTPRRDAPSRGRWQCETQAGNTASGSAKGA